MDYMTCMLTDAGIKKKVNQDSLLICKANSIKGKIILAAVCDGVGGLSSGEIASSMMVSYLKDWFHKQFPFLLKKENYIEVVKKDLELYIRQSSSQIRQYGESNNISLGTTLSLSLIIGTNMITLHIGDSRIYCIKNKTVILTRNHTLVQELVDRHLISSEQAKKDPRRNRLLQCVGVTQNLNIDLNSYVIEKNDVIILCSDGFYNSLSDDRMLTIFHYSKILNKEACKKKLIETFQMIKDGKETDNISAIVIKAGDNYG